MFTNEKNEYKIMGHITIGSTSSIFKVLNISNSQFYALKFLSLKRYNNDKKYFQEIFENDKNNERM